MPPGGTHRLNINTEPDESEEPDDFTHYVHLADGRVIKIVHPGGVLSDHYAEDNKRIQVIGVYPREHFVED